MLIRITIVASLVGLACLTCCSKREPVVAAPEVEWPEGTILVIDGVPIFQQEIDELIEALRLMDPDKTLPQLQRYALTNVALPRVVGMQLDTRHREVVMDQAERLHTTLLAGGEPGEGQPEMRVFEQGWWKDAGIDVWAKARNMEAGEWTVHESVGSFLIFRLREKPPEPWGRRTAMPIEMYILPYLPQEDPKALLEDGIDFMNMEILDPKWRTLVPQHYKNRMDAVTPGSEVEKS